jgi:hypothetical protein
VLWHCWSKASWGADLAGDLGGDHLGDALGAFGQGGVMVSERDADLACDRAGWWFGVCLRARRLLTPTGETNAYPRGANPPLEYALRSPLGA